MAELKTAEPRTISSLIGEALDKGVRFVRKGDRLRVIGPKEHRDLIHELRKRRDELDPLFEPGPGRSVCLAKIGVYPYSVWNGEQLRSCCSLDTETVKIAGPGDIPQLVLASAYDGETAVLIRPEDMDRFLIVHGQSIICGHNFAGFDFWILMRHCGPEAQAVLWQMLAECRIRDSQILDGLYQLAKRDRFPSPRDLGELARYYTDLGVDKSDPVRLRHGLIRGLPWEVVPRMFFDYPIIDAIAGFDVYEELVQRTNEVLGQHDIPCETVQKYGRLSEQVQVKAAVALANITHNGICVDREYLDQIRQGLEQRNAELLIWLDAEVPGLFRRDKDFQLVMTSSNTPSKSTKILREVLVEIASELGEEPERSKTTKEITTKREFWQQFDHWPFIANWIALEENSKLLSFFRNLKTDRIHPRYNTLVRTGRTSSYWPNIQQLPRDGHVRDGIVARDGYSLYAVDYSFIELRTLAVVCEARYGFSRLGEVIRKGIDPHRYTAAMFEGLTSEQFGELPVDRQAELRQRAKAINFGFPGGLGVRTLVKYAKTTYGVTMTLDEARRFRDKLINEVYPELARYLSSDDYSIVAEQLGCTSQDLRRRFARPSHLGCMRRIISGETTRSGTRELHGQDLLNKAWNAVAELNQNPDLAGFIQNRDTSEESSLAKKLFASPITTLTGRIRGRVSFTAARNTPFQGLAADGAKLALYDLVRTGYRVVAFIHDEFVIELSDDADWTQEPHRIDKIVCDAMSSVCNGFPIDVEGTRSKRWYKEAKPTRDEATGELICWEPKQKDKTKPNPAIAETGPRLNRKPASETSLNKTSDTPQHERKRSSHLDSLRKRKGKLTPPLTWFGGKTYLSKRIVELMPDHTVYLEPFFGGGAVLWAKPHEGISEVVNDIYCRLANFYKHLADPDRFEQFYRRVESLPFSKQLWDQSQQQSDDPLEDAVRFFVLNRQSRTGQMQDFATLSTSRTRRGINEQVSAWLGAIAGLPAVHDRLRRVVVHNTDAVDLIRKHSDPSFCIYADPPYLAEARTAKDVYAHEMSVADHERLLETLLHSKSKILLSGYPSQLYDRKLSQWNRIEIEIDNKASGARSKRKMTEVIWMNY